MIENYTIVGSGIIGLSIAEYFSRQCKHVTIISNNHPLSGSYAAAANLASKGQLYARDSHFDLKLQAKKIYPIWINNLLKEVPNFLSPSQNIDQFFKVGSGIDYFANSIDRNRHLKRVLQDKNELQKRNLPTDSIQENTENTIIYNNESWISSDFIISLLKAVLLNRGVQFSLCDFELKTFHEFNMRNERSCLIFCTGAWTKQLLNSLQIPLPKKLNKSERMTIGSTFFYESSFNKFSPDHVLDEIISSNLKQKATLSGNDFHTILSSSSVKIQNTYDTPDSLINKNIELKLLASDRTEEINFQNKFKEKTGIRVGYGHSEICTELIDLKNKNSLGITCCGAHKSGFLFAPILGQYIHDLII